MIWFYKRDRASLSVETRYDNSADEYVAVLFHADGRQQTERFTTREAFREWLQALEQRLAHEQWAADGPPHVLPDGWPDKPPLM
jgi:anti-sigma-K factor RskA